MAGEFVQVPIAVLAAYVEAMSLFRKRLSPLLPWLKDACTVLRLIHFNFLLCLFKLVTINFMVLL